MPTPEDLLEDYYELPWKRYEVLRGCTPAIASDPAVLVCRSGSAEAARVGANPDRFYLDVELAAAGGDPNASARVGRLVQEWEDNEERCLTIISDESLASDHVLVFVCQ